MINWKHVSDIVAVIVIVGCATAVSVMWYHGWFHKPADACCSAPPAVSETHKFLMPEPHKFSLRRPAVKVPGREVPRPKAAPQPKKLPPGNKKPTYSRVLPGGKVDGLVDCKTVQSVSNLPYDQIEREAVAYGIPAAAVRHYKMCFK